jgi:hypothetical protein
VTARAAALIAAGALAAIPSSAAAQAPATTLTATGSADVAPDPQNRRSETSIRRAVEEAEAAALPRAVSDAREHAARLAAAAGLRLGPLISIADAPANAFPFYYGQVGRFPDGRFCGTVRRTRTVVRNGVRRRVSAGTRRVCRVPGRVFAAVQLTYAVTPAS